MNRILHILKELTCPEALNLIEQQSALGGALHPSDLAILLIQNAVKLTPSLGTKIYVLEEDAKARGVKPPFESVDYKKMVEMILAADTVMLW